MNHVRKSFGDLEVLKDISLKVEEGEVLSIIGPSGSGKSTLLRCAAMLEMMDGGDLTYLGEQAVTMQNGKSVYASAMRRFMCRNATVRRWKHRQKSCCRKWDSQEKKRRIRVSFPAVSVRGLRLRVR